MIVLSGNNECYTATSGLVTANCELKSNQTEAGTKVVLHAIQIIQCTPFKVIVRNPSRGSDIMILALSLTAVQSKAYIDYRSGKERGGSGSRT